jgi:DNA-binding NtrC family response regulator
MADRESHLPLALIVDDDPSVLASMRELVADEGFDTLTAASVTEARAHIAADPDLVLLDLILPDGSAMDLFDDLRAKGNAYVVLLTGHATLHTAINAFRAGASDYVLKPIDIDYLQGILSMVKSSCATRAASAADRAQIHAQHPRLALVGATAEEPSPGQGNSFSVAVGSTLAAVEQKLILSTLQQCDTREGAARVLGISVKTLYNRMRAYRSS